MENSMTMIGFKYQDAFGSYEATSTFTIDSEFESEIDEIGRQLSVFLNQIGYIRPNGHILMADVTEDEQIVLEAYLEEYREQHSKESEEPEE